MPKKQTDAVVNVSTPVSPDAAEHARQMACRAMNEAVSQGEGIVADAARALRAAMAADAATIAYDDAELWRLSFVAVATEAGVKPATIRQRWARVRAAVSAHGLEFLPCMTEKAVKARERRDRRSKATEAARDAAVAIVDVAKAADPKTDNPSIVGELVAAAERDIRNRNYRDAAAKLLKAADLMER